MFLYNMQLQADHSTNHRIYLQKTGIVEHLDNLTDGIQFWLRNIQPMVKGERQFGADLFAGHLLDVNKRLQQNL